MNSLKATKKGSITHGYDPVSGTEYQLPYTVITGSQDGKTIIITAGIHGSEYTAIESAKRLCESIEPNKLTGKIIVIPLVNQSAFRSRLAYIMPEDGENLNRMFPGSCDGTFSQRLAYHLLNHWIQPSDFYIDMHSGDLGERITPLIFYPTRAEAQVINISSSAAKASGLPHLVPSSADTGAFNAAAKAGIPSILMEAGGNGECNEEEIQLYLNALLAVLNHLGVYETTNETKDAPVTPAEPSVYLKPVKEHYSSADGFWYPLLTVGSIIKKGDKLGEIRTIFNQKIEDIYAGSSGVILYQTIALSIREGGFIAAVSEIADKPYEQDKGLS